MQRKSVVRPVGVGVVVGMLSILSTTPGSARPKNHPSSFNRAPIQKIEARQAAETARAGETGSTNISERRDVEVLLLSWGAFPVEWLSENGPIQSVQELPREAQIQLAFACAGIRNSKTSDLVLIEGAQGQLSQGQKLKNYLVTQQGIAPERIKLVYRDLEEAGAWEGWIHIRPQGVELPVAPTRALASWIDAIRKEKMIALNPAATLQEVPIRTSQAAAVRAEIEREVKDSRPSFKRENRIRTIVSTEYLSVDGLNGNDSLTRAAWMGFRVGGDLAVFHAPIFELGFSGNVARSFLSMSEDARNATATSWVGEGFGVLRANSRRFGIPELRIGLGWMGNNRSASSNLNDAVFLPPVTGPRLRLEVSSRVDGMFRLGGHLGGVSTQNGYQIFDFGGSLSQRLWDNGRQSLSARVGLDAGIARATPEAVPGLTDRETWASFQVGIAANL